MKFEYLLHKIVAPSLLDDLNKLGDDGWEVVFVWPDGTHVLLKRGKQ